MLFLLYLCHVYFYAFMLIINVLMLLSSNDNVTLVMLLCCALLVNIISTVIHCVFCFQMEKVEADLIRSKSLREKQYKEFSYQLEELQRRYEQQVKLFFKSICITLSVTNDFPFGWNVGQQTICSDSSIITLSNTVHIQMKSSRWFL